MNKQLKSIILIFITVLLATGCSGQYSIDITNDSIKENFNISEDKNIVFITLMMDDKRERWVSDVEKYNIEWLNLSDLKGIRNSEIAKDYNVSAIPASFVINPDGIIIDRDLRGERILSTLKEYFK